MSDCIKCLCIFTNLSDLHCDCTCVTLANWWSVVCYPNKVDIAYTPILTPDCLYRLRPSGHSQFRLNNAAWRTACEAGVAPHRPTHRVCRRGARKQRPIPVVVSTRPTAHDNPEVIHNCITLPSSNQKSKT